MSMDEIKTLAQQAFVDVMASHRAGLHDVEVRCRQYAAALRAYAEMVERCEKKRKELDEEWFFDGAAELTMPMEDCYEIIDYIFRGDAEEGGVKE